MENVTITYKRHLAGFIESFEEDIHDQLYTEIKEAIEYTLGEVAFSMDVDIDDYVDEENIFEDYLKERARRSSAEDPWYVEKDK